MTDYQTIYRFILPLHIMLCFILGICFYLIKHEGTPKLKGYYIGRYMVASAYILTALVCFVEYFFLKDKSISTTQIMFLIFNAVVTSLFAMGLTKMVDTTFITKKRVIMEIVFAVMVSTPMVAVGILGDGSNTLLLNNTLIVCASLIFIKQVFNYTIFGKRYINTKIHLDNYFSSDMSIHLDWVNRSFALFSTVMIIALVGCTIPYFWVIITIIFIIWSTFFYIFISTVNYAPKLMIIEPVLEDGGEEFVGKIENKDEEKGVIPVFAALDKWVEEEKFLHQGITIEEVASSIGANRNKISLHINTYLNMSFREWITKLRMDKAKEILSNDSDTSINDIAQKVSISNRANFDKMFKKFYGVSPAVFRAKNNETSQEKSI